MPTLAEIFPDPQALLALNPEELAGLLIEIPDGLLFDRLKAQVSPGPDGSGYATGWVLGDVQSALAAALSWLETQGIVVRDPNCLTVYSRTRKGRAIRSHSDLEAFRKGTLPLDLLQQSLADKVYHLFLRGDQDQAVFQAFKEVEVIVRKAANAKGAGYPDDLVGTTLMRRAFNCENGPLTYMSLVASEREAELHLFSGAIGHGKNPPSHRDVNISRQEAARLIVFASHLLAIVEQRSM